MNKVNLRDLENKRKT